MHSLLHSPPSDLPKLFTHTRAHLKHDTHSKKAHFVHTTTKTEGRNSQARSEPKPATSPFDFMHFLAQHVQGHVAAQCHLRHLPVLQAERDLVTGPKAGPNPIDSLRIIGSFFFMKSLKLDLPEPQNSCYPLGVTTGPLKRGSILGSCSTFSWSSDCIGVGTTSVVVHRSMAPAESPASLDNLRDAQEFGSWHTAHNYDQLTFHGQRFTGFCKPPEKSLTTLNQRPSPRVGSSLL